MKLSSPPKFILLENFTFLLSQLDSFDDPQFTYKWQGRQDLRGGKRRKHRANSADFQGNETFTEVPPQGTQQQAPQGPPVNPLQPGAAQQPQQAQPNPYNTYAQGAQINKAPASNVVNFGTTQIECDEWHISHPDYKSGELKEKYPKNQYTCLITSRASLKNGTAKRYYVSCDCMDFDTTFKEELIKYGYTNGTTLPSTGKKLLAPAVCKHLYTILMREYGDIIAAETKEETSAEILQPEKEKITASWDIEPREWEEPEETWEEPEQEPQPPLPVKKRGRIPKSPQEKKAEYEKIIRRSLKFFSNIMPNNVDIYKNARQSDTTYKKYKFMVKKYFQGWVIVFTNPQLNPLRDKIKDKEIVPLTTKTAQGTIPTGDSIVVYTKYFTKDELMNMIRSETREIQPNQIDKLNKSGKKYKLTEGIEVLETDTDSILTLLLGLF